MAEIEFNDAGREVVATYAHPQGKRITVWADGSYECRDANGKKKPTSANPDSLAAGHGAWQRVIPHPCVHCGETIGVDWEHHDGRGFTCEVPS
jgi:hypothetical protein